jgi:serine/threonine protein kinase
MRCKFKIFRKLTRKSCLILDIQNSLAAAQSNTPLDLRVGQLAIRQEFLNLSELKHCVAVREKLLKKGRCINNFGEVLVQERYLTPENLEYLLMIAGAEKDNSPVTMEHIESEFRAQVKEIREGAIFGNYKIHGELGRGGMGVVLRAVDIENDEECALKILIGGDKATVRDIERFKKEATVMMPLIHPGIVKIHDVGRVKGLDFIAMEYVCGQSLKQVAKENPDISPMECLEIIRSAAEAVAFIHGEGIIHRDIKPENIMVRDSDGSAVLMDFGLAGWDKIEVMAGRGSIGTPMYQPPEQAEVGGPFGKISPASDVYGLGATLYYLLASRHPFTGRSVKEVREKIKRVPPTPPSAHRPEIPEVVEALVLRCMKKRQTERFSTPKDLVENIDKILKLISSSGRRKRVGRNSGKGSTKNFGKKATGKNPRVQGRNTQKLRAQKRSRKAANSATVKKSGPNRRNTDKIRRKDERPKNSKKSQQNWYENPVVLIAGAIVSIIVLIAVGAILLNN